MVKFLLAAGLLAWGALAWWQLRSAQRAGDAMTETLKAAWPAGAVPEAGARQKLLGAAENVGRGEFRSVVDALGPVAPPSAEEKMRAQRFFAAAQSLRDRFVDAAAEAKVLEADGVEVGSVRDALSRALVAAAGSETNRVTAQLELAETALADMDPLAGRGNGAGSVEAVAAMVRRIEPSYQLGLELMTEGHAAAEKLVARASDCFRAGENRKAMSLLRLAAGLLGVDQVAETGAAVPAWFQELTLADEGAVSEQRASAEVDLAEAMAASQSPDGLVVTVIKRARRELEGGSPGAASWWATVALNALGMTDEAVRAATKREQSGTTE
jgi:hypothetical protein